MSFKVGQVLYVVLRKEASVYPMQVIEEITKKTLDGELTTYMVRAGADKEKILSINDIDGEIFDSPEKAKKTLIDRVSQTIVNRVDLAINKAREWYPSGFESSELDPLDMIKKSTTPGVKNAPAAAKRELHVSNEVAELAAEFAQEAEDATVVEFSDGAKVKVNSVKLPKELQG